MIVKVIVSVIVENELKKYSEWKSSILHISTVHIRSQHNILDFLNKLLSLIVL